MKEMSLLEYDIRMSRYHKYLQFSRMSKTEKDKIQVKYIKRLIDNVQERVKNEETWGKSYIQIQPDWFYPYKKMIQDVKRALDENKVMLEHTYILSRGNNRIACCFSWIVKD